MNSGLTEYRTEANGKGSWKNETAESKLMQKQSNQNLIAAEKK